MKMCSYLFLYLTKVMCHYLIKTLIIKFIESKLNLHITTVLEPTNQLTDRTESNDAIASKNGVFSYDLVLKQGVPKKIVH